MIDRIIAWSLGNRLLVLALAAGLLAWGSWSAWRTPVDVFPDLTAPTVTVVAEAHGMPPEDVEIQVTLPIETALNGASGVRRVRSSSGVGISVVTIEFDWGTDIYRARQVVAEKLQIARASLPVELPPPVLTPVTSIMGEVMFIALQSDVHDEMQLKTAADWVVRRRLLAVPGVAEVIASGVLTRQFQVIVRPERLAALEITLDQVVDAVREAGRNASAGFVVENDQEFLIQGLGRVRGRDDIALAVVGQRDGVPVLVRDLAEVVIGPAPRRGTGSYNNSPAVVIGIQKQPDANTLALTERLDLVIGEIQASLEPGMRIETRAFRQADFIKIAIDNLGAALRDGALLVVVIMFVFLLSARATGIALLAIPLSLLAAVLAIRALGGSINSMTLGGMAIALGALVDDAIIVVENIVRRLRENRARSVDTRHSAVAVVYEATREIESSIVFATLIIILVFLPLFFLAGVEGRLLQPLGLAYIVSLAASLLVALTVTPVLCLLMLPGRPDSETGHDNRFTSWLKRGYRPLLEIALVHWRLVTLAAASLLAAACIALVFTGRGFLPEFNEGSLTISVVTVPGTALEKSDRIGSRVEQILLAEPEVVATTRRTGRAELDPHAQAVYASEIDVNLEMDKRSKEELLAALRRQFSAIAGTNIVIGQPISHRIDHMLSGTRANIAVKIFGADLVELRRLGSAAERIMREVPGAVDVAMEQQSEIPVLSVRFDRAALAGYGMPVGRAAEMVEAAFGGAAAGSVLEGSASFDVVVRYSERFRDDLDRLPATLFRTPSGAEVTLDSIAEIRRTRGPDTISRENVQRKQVVMANVAGRDLIGVVEDIRRRIGEEIELPSGYHIEFGGQFESAEAAGQRLLVLGLAVIAGIFLLLVTAFTSMRDAVLVMLNLPLALIGGVVGVWLAEGVVTIAALIGFITLFGIATRNGVILVDHIRRLVAEHDMNPDQAVRIGAEQRLIPILMTALATALALVPLALATGQPGSEIQAPMAIVILCGLLSSTALNMIVVPALYRRFGAAAAANFRQGPSQAS